MYTSLTYLNNQLVKGSLQHLQLEKGILKGPDTKGKMALRV
ncbi:MAG: hypothetical protein ACTJG1_00295 [Enterococcus gilvus]